MSNQEDTKLFTSQSDSLSQVVYDLKEQICDLRKQQKELVDSIKYLNLISVELSNDMQVIYTSLEQVLSSFSDPADEFMFSFTKPDDELPN
jgi:hemerythrin-like domain-containing protein